VERLVRATVAQMELGPYAERLAGQLSGGMKRKLVSLRERLYNEEHALMLY
jgi:ABC-type nitrate/sulfonate/bicarbonate transport system ATPase subunit